MKSHVGRAAPSPAGFDACLLIPSSQNPSSLPYHTFVMSLDICCSNLVPVSLFLPFQCVSCGHATLTADARRA